MAWFACDSCGAQRTGIRAPRLGWVYILLIAVLCAPAAGGQLRQYETPYYIIHSDMDSETVQEAIIRTSVMAADYVRLFSGFAGQINRKWEMYLFARHRDYIDAGGIEGSSGIFMRRGKDVRLMTFAQQRGVSWHTVQHEGAHQFVYRMIGDEVPAWVNEGLAEYFGASLFTGDAMVHGIVSPQQAGQIKQSIRSRKYVAFARVMDADRDRWVEHLGTAPYDQAWSMVHFLLHGDNGKYASQFHAYLLDIGRGGAEPKQAWAKHFGTNIDQFERRWAAWWLAYPSDGSRDVYEEATFRVMTSFLARYLLQNLQLASAEEFFRAAETQPLRLDPASWLPRLTLRQALQAAPELGLWSIERGAQGRWKLICTRPDKARWVGEFRLTQGRVVDMTAQLEHPRKGSTEAGRRTGQTRPKRTVRHEDLVLTAIRQAQLHIKAGLPEKARAVLTEALEVNPRSFRAQKARQMLAELE